MICSWTVIDLERIARKLNATNLLRIARKLNATNRLRIVHPHSARLQAPEPTRQRRVRRQRRSRKSRESRIVSWYHLECR
jgi:hypothetical protein